MSTSPQYDLMVIGAGPGGYEAALCAARRHGRRVVLFERNDLGGTCLNAGCIPTKCLLRSAKALEDCREAAKFGIDAGTASPRLDLPSVQQRKQKVVGTLRRGIGAMLRTAGIEVVNAEATITAPGEITAAGRIYAGTAILIATGSSPAVPPIPGLHGNPAVFDSTQLLDIQEIPRQLCIIGGGVIGLEFATFFAAAGTRVTIMEMMPQIAPVLDDEIARKLLAECKRRGITFLLGCRVQEIEGRTLFYTDSSGILQNLTADCFLNATGRRPNTAGLGLESLGVAVSPHGITTDEYGRTTVSGILACGDVTGRCPLAHAAAREGTAAVNTLFGAAADRVDYAAIPSVIYTHPECAQVGATEQSLRKAQIAYRRISVPMATAGRFLVDNEGQSGTVKVLAAESDRKILGIHAIGGSCGEFICAAAFMVGLHLTAETVEKIVFPHPTVSEALREAILRM